mmetsp:Transcript_4892/g.12063  ORF Transcript_4892/g.12063 Transcript_4892/m.12063 type:complete len:268 (+) Transcript_4892:968-1771(+)
MKLHLQRDGSRGLRAQRHVQADCALAVAVLGATRVQAELRAAKAAQRELGRVHPKAGLSVQRQVLDTLQALGDAPIMREALLLQQRDLLRQLVASSRERAQGLGAVRIRGPLLRGRGRGAAPKLLHLLGQALGLRLPSGLHASGPLKEALLAASVHGLELFAQGAELGEHRCRGLRARRGLFPQHAFQRRLRGREALGGLLRRGLSRGGHLSGGGGLQFRQLRRQPRRLLRHPRGNRRGGFAGGPAGSRTRGEFGHPRFHPSLHALQ